MTSQIIDSLILSLFEILKITDVPEWRVVFPSFVSKVWFGILMEIVCSFPVNSHQMVFRAIVEDPHLQQ